VLLAAAATFAGAAVQSATGFGFALILGPAIFAVLEPREAVTALLLLGAAINLLVLFGERRRPPIRWSLIAPLLAAAAPGLALGALVLEALSKSALQISLGLCVIAAALVQARRPHPVGGAGSLPASLAVGLTSGTLTTSTSISGPPLVLWLEARGLQPDEMRTSLAAAFLSLNVAGGAVVLATAGGGEGVAVDVLPPLLALTIAGHLAGLWVFRRIDPARFRALVLLTVAAAGVASVAAGLAGP
jgi:uncharacterized membrane protein YfcA